MDQIAEVLGSRLPDRWPSKAGRIGSVGFGLILLLGGSTRETTAQEQPSPSNEKREEPSSPRIAATPPENSAARGVLDVDHSQTASLDPFARARRMIGDCANRYRLVEDYSCTFYKRERVDGQLYTPHVMVMKARTSPPSLYFKFIQPNAGREAIYVHGRNHNKILAHDVGLGRMVAGTMHLDPKGGMAMEENRHPVTEAGLGSMIETIRERWTHDLTPANAQVIFHPQANVAGRPCTMIEATHPSPGKDLLFHKVKLYIDKELNLPIRFEAYDWPAKPGAEPLLMEEYTYVNLRVNLGLKDRDFDPKNSQYSYGRF
ncbi:DUF1571 domain-containing protein [Tundrisphaera lichenicola]|uniref:DUF1571 domain-containing protein n=1 Tax=Tundrisphaera lichenicola TaxID=2029860 RepID=UPI003EC04EC1